MMRALSQRGICHFIFCGSTGLVRQLRNPKSKFYNFPQPISLGFLNSSTAQSLIIKPLEELRIDLEKQDLMLEKIYNLTSGHPSLIQFLGSNLVLAAYSQESVGFYSTTWSN
jgi:hypothetical protein